jgi:hypothetical protein
MFDEIGCVDIGCVQIDDYYFLLVSNKQFLKRSWSQDTVSHVVGKVRRKVH